MQIFVKTVEGRLITLEVSVTDTIFSIKSKVEQREAIPPSKIFFQKEVEDEKTLSDYQIDNNHVFHMVDQPAAYAAGQPGTAGGAAKSSSQARGSCCSIL